MVLLFTSLYLTNDLKFTMVEAGFVMSLYGIGSVVGSYLGGWLADRYSHKRVMIIALLSCGAILLLLPLTANYYAICTIVFSYAIAADMFRPANTASIVDYSTFENRTRSISLIRLAANVGFTIGPAVGGFIAFYFGYKLLFVIDALTSFSAAWLLYTRLPAKVAEHEDARKAVLADASSSAYRDGPFLVFNSRVLKLQRIRGFLYVRPISLIYYNEIGSLQLCVFSGMTQVKKCFNQNHLHVFYALFVHG